MIIDLILDRRAGDPYNPREAYRYIQEEESIFFDDFPISRAMDGGEEEDVKEALCNYVDSQGYPHEICDYINSVNWLE